MKTSQTKSKEADLILRFGDWTAARCPWPAARRPTLAS